MEEKLASLTTAANSVDSNESELVASNGDGADTPESPAASIEPPKKKAKVVPTKSQKTLKKASKLAKVYAANMHARQILVHSSEHKAKLLQADNDKLEKELQKVKDRVVELEEEIDDKVRLLEGTKKALNVCKKDLQKQQETRIPTSTTSKPFPGK